MFRISQEILNSTPRDVENAKSLENFQTFCTNRVGATLYINSIWKMYVSIYQVTWGAIMPIQYLELFNTRKTNVKLPMNLGWVASVWSEYNRWKSFIFSQENFLVRYSEIISHNEFRLSNV